MYDTNLIRGFSFKYARKKVHLVVCISGITETKVHS